MKSYRRCALVSTTKTVKIECNFSPIGALQRDFYVMQMFSSQVEHWILERCPCDAKNSNALRVDQENCNPLLLLLLLIYVQDQWNYYILFTQKIKTSIVDFSFFIKGSLKRSLHNLLILDMLLLFGILYGLTLIASDQKYKGR